MLVGRGESVIGVDSGHPDEAERLAGAGVEVHLDGDGIELLDRVSTVVKSPGVPQEAPVIAAAHALELPVLGELEIAWRELPNRFIGVTGTNGKTTVSELLGHIYRVAGEPVAVAGNIGSPVSDLVGEIDSKTTVVCECSSFQLEDTEAFAPECGVFLNLAEDHLDRHRTIEGYLEAKLRLFEHQGPGDIAVLSEDNAYDAAGWEPDDGAVLHEVGWDPGDEELEPGSTGDYATWGRGSTLITYCSARASSIGERRGAESPGAQESRAADRAGGTGEVSACQPAAGVAAPCDMTHADGALSWRGEHLADAAELSLLGHHNVDNAMAAGAAALAMGVDIDGVRAGLRSFTGVPHRLERVAEIDGVIYVNDSKATNPAAAAAAMRSFDGPVRAILGGSLKGGGFTEFAELIVQRGVACHLIGEAAERIERELRAAQQRASAAEAGAFTDQATDDDLRTAAAQLADGSHRPDRALGAAGDPVVIERHSDLAHAVEAASAEASAGDVVILAPACASFDAYRDFEARGEHFRALVHALGQRGDASR